MLLSFALGVSVSLAGAWGVMADKPDREELGKVVTRLQSQIDDLNSRRDTTNNVLSEIESKISRIEAQLELLLEDRGLKIRTGK